MKPTVIVLAPPAEGPVVAVSEDLLQPATVNAAAMSAGANTLEKILEIGTLWTPKQRLVSDPTRKNESRARRN
jgi:hypothetical protein